MKKYYALAGLTVLLAALAGGIYLVGQKQIFKPKASASEVEALTSQLIAKKDQAGGARVSSQAEVGSMSALALRRKELLLQEMERDPQAFLNHATLAGQAANFPKAVQANLESEVSAQGNLAVNIADYGDESILSSKYSYYLKQEGGQSYQMFFADNPPSVSGKATVRGVALEGKMAVETASDANKKYNLQMTAQTVQTPSGPQDVMVVMTHFSNEDPNNKPFDPERLRQVIFDGPNGLSGYFGRSSYNKISFSGFVSSTWITIPSTDSQCADGVWMDEADTAATNAGINVRGYRFTIYVFTHPVDACKADDNISNMAGSGDIGPGDATGTRSRVVVMKRQLTDPLLYAHEIGHNLGMYHAASMNCLGKFTDAEANCTVEEYGNWYDVMGGGVSRAHNLDVPHRLQLGWLPQDKAGIISSSGDYVIDNLDSNPGQPGVKKTWAIRKEDTNEWYYLEYRGNTSDNLPQIIKDGVMVNLWCADPRVPAECGETGNRRSFLTYMKDPTPNSLPNLEHDDDFTDAAFFDRWCAYDQINRITIKQLSHGPDAAVVNVKFDSDPSDCPQSALPAPPAPSQSTQTIDLGTGWNLVGITLDMGRNYYTAQDFTSDLNKTVDVRQIVRWKNGAWETYVRGFSANNFYVNPGEAYFVRSYGAAVATISGRKASFALPVISAGWNFASFAEVPWDVNTAEKMIQWLNHQGGNVEQIVRFYTGRWETHVSGFGVNNFEIQPGLGYAIKSGGGQGRGGAGALYLPDDSAVPSPVPTPASVISQGFYRTVPIENGNPVWSKASEWHGPLTPESEGLPGAGNIDSMSDVIIGQTQWQSFWRGNQGYYKTVPIENGSPVWNRSSEWKGPLTPEGEGYPGTGAVHAEDSDVVGSTLWQTFWRGNQGFYRTVPVEGGGPVWSRASNWNGPLTLDGEGYPGLGDFDAQSSVVIGSTYWQSFWRGNQGYYRTVPIENGNPVWSKASEWHGPLTPEGEGYPGSGKLVSQSDVVVGSMLWQSFWRVSNPSAPNIGSQTLSGGQEFTVGYKIASSKEQLDQVPEMSYTPQAIPYTFTDTQPGDKFIFVRFISNKGRLQDVSLKIVYNPVVVPTPVSSPSPLPVPESSSIPIPLPLPSGGVGDAREEIWSRYVAEFKSGASGADLNHDGKVDLFDYSLFVEGFEK